MELQLYSVNNGISIITFVFYAQATSMSMGEIFMVVKVAANVAEHPVVR
jgi:hypothetical protein